MEFQGTTSIIVICLTTVVCIITILTSWYFKEKKRSAKRLRELRDAISEMSQK